MKKLKMYMAYDCNSTLNDGVAVIVFAHTVREAKKIAWPVMQNYGIEEYIDMRVRLEKGMSWLWKEKESDDPHYIEPKICNTCELWGQSEIIDGLCEDCRKEAAVNGGFVLEIVNQDCQEDERDDFNYDENNYDESEIDPEMGAHG